MLPLHIYNHTHKSLQKSLTIKGAGQQNFDLWPNILQSRSFHLVSHLCWDSEKEVSAHCRLYPIILEGYYITTYTILICIMWHRMRKPGFRRNLQFCTMPTQTKGEVFVLFFTKNQMTIKLNLFEIMQFCFLIFPPALLILISSIKTSFFLVYNHIFLAVNLLLGKY